MVVPPVIIHFHGIFHGINDSARKGYRPRPRRIDRRTASWAIWSRRNTAWLGDLTVSFSHSVGKSYRIHIEIIWKSCGNHMDAFRIMDVMYMYVYIYMYICTI